MVYGTLDHHVYSCKIKKKYDCNQHEWSISFNLLEEFIERTQWYSLNQTSLTSMQFYDNTKPKMTVQL